MKIPSDDVSDAVTAYAANPAVEYAEPNYVFSVGAFPQTLPNDTFVDPDQNGTWSYSFGMSHPDLWGAQKINAHQAWQYAQGANVVVAVVDTGVNYNLADLAGRIWTNPGEVCGNGVDDDGNEKVDDCRGYDFAYSDSDPMGEHPHGTHVAGTIAAVGNNGQGLIGIAPQAKIMAAKGMRDDGTGELDKISKAIYYAVAMGADIINCSFGAKVQSLSLEYAVDWANENGVLVVAAAGNDGADAAAYQPAGFDAVLTVGATDDKAGRALVVQLGKGSGSGRAGSEDRLVLAAG